MADATESPGAGPRRERVFTWPLVTFLVLVFGFDAVAAYRRYSLPGLADSIEQLADGDDDSAERGDLLGQLSRLGPASADLRVQWAAMLASIVLEDRDAYGKALQALGGGPVPKRVPGPGEREFLGLGDTMLKNISAALLAEAAMDRPAAATLWRQIAAQSRLTGRPFAGELAAAAEQRLH